MTSVVIINFQLQKSINYNFNYQNFKISTLLTIETPVYYVT